MENIVVILIVAIAGAYLFRRFYRGTKKGIGCGCGSCDTECMEKGSLPCAPDDTGASNKGVSPHEP